MWTDQRFPPLSLCSRTLCSAAAGQLHGENLLLLIGGRDLKLSAVCNTTLGSAKTKTHIFVFPTTRRLFFCRGGRRATGRVGGSRRLLNARPK